MEVLKTQLLEHGILHIQFNKPAQLNALNHAVLQNISTVLDDAKLNPAVKSILLSGEGKAFCAGADINELAQTNGQTGLVFARFGQTVFRKLETLGKPSLAAIHGFAFGGGLELAMSATIRIASKNTVFGQPEIKLGVIPGFGGTQRLARLIGKGRALELCLTGRRFSVEEALQFGLVSEVLEQDALITRAIIILTDLSKLGRTALSAIMTTINSGYDLSLEDGLELEATHFALCCATKDKQEGVSAFLEKREAIFTGD